MGALADLRTDLAAALSSGEHPLRVETRIPVTFVPPVVLLVGGDPWLSFEGVRRQGVCQFDVIVVAGLGNAPESHKKLDGWVERALEATFDTGHDWRAVTLSAPYDLVVQQGEVERTYLAAKITASLPIVFTKEE